MRSLIVAVASVSALAFASSAFAQTTQQSTQPSPPGSPQSSLDDVTREASWMVYGAQYVQALSEQRFIRERSACLPWLPNTVPVVLP